MHKCYVYKGNSSFLIRELLKERGNWEETEDKYKATKVCEFVWKPTNLSDMVADSDFQQFMYVCDRTASGKTICITNHLQGNRCITTKTGILRTLDTYYKQQESLCSRLFK